MNETPIVHSHEITIRLDEHEDGLVEWIVLPDDPVWLSRQLSMFELAEQGAPLSMLAVRTLWKLCVDGTVYSALELANAFRQEIARQRGKQVPRLEAIEFSDGATIN